MKKFLWIAATIMLITSTLKVAAAEYKPVSYTAPLTLQWLDKAKVPEAELIMIALDSPNIFDDEDAFSDKRLLPTNAAFIELRYSALNDFIRSNDFKNVMDIGCGFSPRGIVMAYEGRRWIGVDLAAAAADAETLVSQCVDEKLRENISYVATSVTERKAMLNAAKQFKRGEVCIVAEGLVMYLDRAEQAAMFNNVRDILKKRGGCMITTDLSVHDFFTSTATALFNRSIAENLYMSSRSLYEETAHINFDETMFASDDEAIAFLNDLGLDVKKVPLLNGDVDLYSASMLNEQQIDLLKDVTRQKFLWIITAR